MIRIGTQTFGLGKELSADLAGTIRDLHEMGFNAIEPFVLFKGKQGRMPKNLWALDTLARAKEIMDQFGMVIPSVHIGIGFGGLSMPAGMAIKKILALHQSIGVKYFVVSGPFGDVKSARKWGKLMRKISDGVKPHGCTMVCHNHDDEFNKITVGGKNMAAMDYFMELAGPDVLLQLDIGWASVAGDEMEAARRYADRIVSIHLKDFYPGYRDGNYTSHNMPVDQFAPIGEGEVKTAEILAIRENFPHFSGSVIVDQDHYSGDMLESLKIGCRNIRAMLN